MATTFSSRSHEFKRTHKLCTRSLWSSGTPSKTKDDKLMDTDGEVGDRVTIVQKDRNQ